MPRYCERVPFAGGYAIICGSAPATKKATCKGCGRKRADLLCDAVVGLFGETCDADICKDCAIQRDDDLHLCPAHRDEFC